MSPADSMIDLTSTNVSQVTPTFSVMFAPLDYVLKSNSAPTPSATARS